ncbi:hypothetical protein HZB00_01580 [Candidatus Woesearchaeota archaeon]|nr:hypothetical protein [Candidatus Woesearchaeota archaeon]
MEYRDFGSRGGGRSNFSSGPREMHDAVCAECGAQTQVPFKPQEGRPVFCRACYSKKKEQSQ